MSKNKVLELTKWNYFLGSEILHTDIAILNMKQLFNEYKKLEDSSPSFNEHNKVMYSNPFFQHYVFMGISYSIIGLRKLFIDTKTEKNNFIKLYIQLQDDSFIKKNNIGHKILENQTNVNDNHVRLKNIHSNIGLFESIEKMKCFCKDQILNFENNKESWKKIEQWRNNLAHGTVNMINDLYVAEKIETLEYLSNFAKEKYNVLFSKLGYIPTKFDNRCDIKPIIDSYLTKIH